MNTSIDEQDLKWEQLCLSAKELPNEHQELLPGVKWGDCSQLYTPAFWKMQYLSHRQIDNTNNIYKLGSNLLEEIVVCLLGGFGMPSDIGIAAFERLKKDNLIRHHVSFEEIHNALCTPYVLKNGRIVTYRFHNQKSMYIHSLLSRDDLDKIPIHNDIQFRDWLLTINGIGLKTASWITRNWLHSDNVAILDIHILRAGVLAGFYKENVNDLTKHYLYLERQYLDFCRALEVSSAIMDAIIWDFMKKTNRLALSALKHSN